MDERPSATGGAFLLRRRYKPPVCSFTNERGFHSYSITEGSERLSIPVFTGALLQETLLDFPGFAASLAIHVIWPRNFTHLSQRAL